MCVFGCLYANVQIFRGGSATLPRPVWSTHMHCTINVNMPALRLLENESISARCDRSCFSSNLFDFALACMCFDVSIRTVAPVLTHASLRVRRCVARSPFAKLKLWRSCVCFALFARVRARMCSHRHFDLALWTATIPATPPTTSESPFAIFVLSAWIVRVWCVSLACVVCVFAVFVAWFLLVRVHRLTHRLSAWRARMNEWTMSTHTCFSLFFLNTSFSGFTAVSWWVDEWMNGCIDERLTECYFRNSLIIQVHGGGPTGVVHTDTCVLWSVRVCLCVLRLLCSSCSEIFKQNSRKFSCLVGHDQTQYYTGNIFIIITRFSKSFNSNSNAGN